MRRASLGLAVFLWLALASPAWGQGLPSKQAIAFTRFTDGFWQIWTAEPDGGDLRQITTSPMDKRNPIWRPSKDQLLFHSANNELFLHDLDSGREVQTLPEFGRIAQADFTPDGKRLIFTRFDENLKDAGNLWFYDFDSEEAVLLTREPGLQYGPRVSPDGLRVAYVAGQGWGTHEIWLMDLETREKKRLTENETYDLEPEFSPDGSRIAYASNLMGNYDIWLMDSDGGNPRKITKPLGIDNHPTWSPDGKRLAIASQRGGGLQIWLIDLEGKEWTQLTQGESEAREPAWRR